MMQREVDAISELRAGAPLDQVMLAAVISGIGALFERLRLVWAARPARASCVALPSGPFLWFRGGRFEIETFGRTRQVTALSSAPLAIRLAAVAALPELEARLWR